MGRLIAIAVVLIACGDNRATVSDARGDGPPDTALCATLVCDDGNACTVDLCDAVEGCRNISRDRCAEPLCMLGTCAGADTDGDGLSDAAESQGYVDLDCDGVFRADIDLHLPDASVTRKTIYLEYDYMTKPGAGNACSSDVSCTVAGEQCIGICSATSTRDCATDSECPAAETCMTRVCTHSHRPTPAALALVVDAFEARGIDLVIDPFPTKLIETDVVTFNSTLPVACVGPSAADFFALKTTHFDARRRNVYHYAVFGHHATCTAVGASCNACPDDPLTNQKPPFGASGTAELFGNDFIIAMGHFYFGLPLPRTLANEAGTIMHELGHNLGLRHGGHESVPEGKPNYFSVMNLNFQFIGITSATTGTRIDYSGATLATLDENGLVESVGVDEGAADPLHSDDVTNFIDGQGIPATGAGNGAIDWNGVNGIEAGTLGAPVDLNTDGLTSLMTGSNDWTNLSLPFQCTSAGMANGHVPHSTIANEPGPALRTRLRR